MKIKQKSAKVKIDSEMQKAGLYLRFSDLKQRGGVTIKVQEEACRNYCKSKGYVVGPVDRNEGKSADGLKESNIKKIRELLEFAKEHKGEMDVLVVYNVSRDARDVEQHYYIKGKLLKMGTRLESATEPIDNTPIGRFLEVFFAGKAQLDNDLKRETSKVTLWARVDQGLWAMATSCRIPTSDTT